MTLDYDGTMTGTIFLSQTVQKRQIVPLERLLERSLERFPKTGLNLMKRLGKSWNDFWNDFGTMECSGGGGLCPLLL